MAQKIVGVTGAPMNNNSQINMNVGLSTPIVSGVNDGVAAGKHAKVRYITISTDELTEVYLGLVNLKI